MIISTKDTWVRYVSKAFVGKSHDYAMMKKEFPPEQRWFADLEVRLDLAFLGFDKVYECLKLYIPHKKPKGGELSEEQKAENKVAAGERIMVEHSIGGMKRYRILSERLRVHDFDLYDDILEVCAGLWNFYLKHK